MTRPLALIGLTLISALTVFLYGGVILAYATLGVAAVLLAVSLAVKRIRRLEVPSAMLIVTIISAVIYLVFTCAYALPLQNKYCTDSDDVHIEGTLEGGGVFEYGYYQYPVRVSAVEGEKANFRLMLYTKEHIFADVSDKISFKGFLQKTEEGRLWADKYFLESFVFAEDYENIECTKAEGFSLSRLAYNVKNALSTGFYTEEEYEVATLSNAVVLGDDSGFGTEFKDAFRLSGLSHITVVSGLHLSIAVLLCKSFLGRLIKNKAVTGILSLGFILGFLLITGFGKSAVRAAVMMSVYLILDMFFYEADSPTSLGLAAILLCLANPYVVGDLGVLLSFSATLGIILIGAPMKRFLYIKIIKGNPEDVPIVGFVFSTFIDGVVASTAATMGTIPVFAVFFGSISLVQVLSNLFIILVVPVFMICSLLCGIFHYLSFAPFIADALAFVSDATGGFIIWVARTFSALPFAAISADYSFVYIWAFSVVVFILVAYYLDRGEGMVLLSVLLSGVILASGFAGEAVKSSYGCKLHILTADDMPTVILETSEGNAIVSCSSDELSDFNIIRELESVNSRGGLMLLSEKSLYNGKEILREFDYEKVLMYDTDKDSADTGEALPESEPMADDFTSNLWGKAKLRVIKTETSVFINISTAKGNVLILPEFGNCEELPVNMRNPYILITCGMLENMDALEFEHLLACGDDFESAAVIKFYEQREAHKVCVNEDIAFEIK